MVDRRAWREVEAIDTPASAGPPVLAGILLGGALVAFLIWRDHVEAAVILAAVVATITLLRRVWPAFDRVFGRFFAAVGHAVGIGLSWLALGLTMLVVVLPVWVITTVLRWDVLEPDHERGGWAIRRFRVWQSRPDRGFANERQTLRWQTRVHGFLVVAVPLAVVAIIAFPLRDPSLRLAGELMPGHLVFGGSDDTAAPVGPGPATDTPGALPDPTGDPPDGAPRDVFLAHAGDPWVPDFFNQYFPVKFAFDPYLTVRAADREEQYVNVHDRVRRSYVPDGAADDPAALDVWFFGGSALFGQGQRDDHTIPSEVVRLAEEAGVPIRAQNFGVPSYMAWQDAVLLAQLLTERPAPDLIVTYEGYNDIVQTIWAGSPTQVSTGFANQVRDALIEGGADLAGADNSAVDPMPRTSAYSPQNSATVFGRAAGTQRDLAEVHDIPIAQYLQPSVWTRDLAVDDATLANIGSDRAYHDSYKLGWNRARELMATDGVVDLGDSLDDLDELVFDDDVHTNETGARVVAEAIYADLADTLQQLHDEKASP